MGRCLLELQLKCEGCFHVGNSVDAFSISSAVTYYQFGQCFGSYCQKVNKFFNQKFCIMCISKKKDRDARKRKKHDPQNMSIRELYVHCRLFGTVLVKRLV